MPEKSLPLLGEITALTIATPDLEQSLAYYSMLGFTEVMRADWPFPWIQVSDGALLIMLKAGAAPYLALTYYVKDIDKVVAGLEEKGIQFVEKAKKADQVKRYLFRSPDGLNISLVGMVGGFKAPPGPDMLHMAPEDYADPEKYTNKTCGMFGELAHPVADIDAAVAFWQLLGFNTISTFHTPYPWAIVTDGLSVVGLHQSSHFSYSAITYFAADMQAKIEGLRKNGLKDFAAHDGSGIVLTTPEQQHIFLFGMVGADKPAVSKPQVKPLVMETERLMMKIITPEILSDIYTTYTDKDIISFMGFSGADELNAERDNWRQGMTTYRISFRLFLMIEKETGKIIGKCGYHNWYALHSKAEMGYRMTDDTKKQQGFMKEAIAAVIRHGFEQMGLNRIEAFVGHENTASLKVVRGFGFTQEGVMRAHYFKDGVIHDSVCFSLLKKEYSAGQKPA